MKKFAEENKVLGKVQLRGGFSDRNGINTVSSIIQYDDFDERTRIVLHNKMKIAFGQINIGITSTFPHSWRDLHLNVLEEVYCIDITKLMSEDELYISQMFDLYIESTIKNDTYDSVLTLIEYIFNLTEKFFVHRQNLIDYDDYIPESETSGHYRQYQFNEKDFINAIFEQENIGYRFVNDRIVKMVDKVEIEEIEQACKNEFDGCRVHIQKAVDFLADREAKDYKNCIKESISAVESICQIITGNSKATLSETLKGLEDKGIVIHSALKSAFSKLYGYTSDEGGVRHAEGMFVSNVTFEEAKFMLVSCSAFVNYLIAQYGKTNKNT